MNLKKWHGNREKYFFSTDKISLTTKQMYSIYRYSSEQRLKNESLELKG